MGLKIFPAGKGTCEVTKAGPCGFIIFGASGDLTEKKLMPSLYSLFSKGAISENFFVVGVARTSLDDSGFRKKTAKAIKAAVKDADTRVIGDFCTRCYYIGGDYSDIQTYNVLSERVNELSAAYETGRNLVFHYATPPLLFGPITEKLGESGLVKKGASQKPFSRIMVEKPFGRDFESAVELNRIIMKYADDQQVYRIDHYLGKNTVQNILVFRFANHIFEPIWNKEHIDHVQISVSEEEGVGSRAGYFEQAGAIRDMLQNHLFQLLSLVAMNPPASLGPEEIGDEKARVFNSLRPFDEKTITESVVRGQYSEGKINGSRAAAYRQEKGVEVNSCVETYFAAKLFIDNERWSGVPFYLRAGKRLDKKETAIHIVFREAQSCLFCGSGIEHHTNVLSFNIQPGQGVTLKFVAKTPGSKMCLAPLDMKFNYEEVFSTHYAEDYETVILDCMNGDHTIFWRKDSIEQSWKILDPVIRRWESCPIDVKGRETFLYPAGSAGPKTAEEFIKRDGREWL